MRSARRQARGRRRAARGRSRRSPSARGYSSARTGVVWRAAPRGAAARDWPRSHAEQVARLQEESVAGAGQAAEVERLGLTERRAVAEEHHGARDRLVGEQEVVPKLGVRAARLPRAVDDQGVAGARIAERIDLLRGVLADVAEENGAIELILDLEPRNVRRREPAAVRRPGEPQMHDAPVHPQPCRGLPGEPPPPAPAPAGGSRVTPATPLNQRPSRASAKMTPAPAPTSALKLSARLGVVNPMSPPHRL